MANLIERLDLCQTPRAPGDHERPDRLDVAVAALALAVGFARQSGPGCLDGIDRIGLARAPAGLAIRPVPRPPPRRCFASTWRDQLHKSRYLRPRRGSRCRSSPRTRRGTGGPQASSPRRPIASSAAATFPSRWVSTPPVNASHLEWSSPSLPSHFVKGGTRRPMCAAPTRSSCCHRAIRRTHRSSRVTSTWNRRPTDRSEQADPQPLLESDRQSQAELKLSTHPVSTVVDAGNISPLSYPLSILCSTGCPAQTIAADTEQPLPGGAERYVLAIATGRGGLDLNAS